MTPFGYMMDTFRSTLMTFINIQNYTLVINIRLSKVYFNDRILVIKTETMYKLIKLYGVGAEDVY